MSPCRGLAFWVAAWAGFGALFACCPTDVIVPAQRRELLFARAHTVVVSWVPQVFPDLSP